MKLRYEFYKVPYSSFGFIYLLHFQFQFWINKQYISFWITKEKEASK